jgi:hypothetical protein
MWRSKSMSNSCNVFHKRVMHPEIPSYPYKIISTTACLDSSPAVQYGLFFRSWNSVIMIDKMMARDDAILLDVGCGWCYGASAASMIDVWTGRRRKRSLGAGQCMSCQVCSLHFVLSAAKWSAFYSLVTLFRLVTGEALQIPGKPMLLSELGWWDRMHCNL